MKKPRPREIRRLADEGRSRDYGWTHGWMGKRSGDVTGELEVTCSQSHPELCWVLRALTSVRWGLRQWGEGQEPAGPYLAALTSDAAVVITGCLVPTHDTLLVFVQVTRDIPWEGGREAGRQAWLGPLTLSAFPGFPSLASPLAQPPWRAGSWRHIGGYLLHPLP